MWLLTVVVFAATMVGSEEAIQMGDYAYHGGDVRLISRDAIAIATIWQEAAGEPYEGKLAVAAVIRNRMKRQYQSDGTVEGTLLKDFQFSGWNTGQGSLRQRSLRLDDQDPIVRDCAKAWKESELIDPTHGAVLYFAPKGVRVEPRWASAESVKLVARIHNHQFYTDEA